MAAGCANEVEVGESNEEKPHSTFTATGIRRAISETVTFYPYISQEGALQITLACVIYFNYSHSFTDPEAKKTSSDHQIRVEPWRNTRDPSPCVGRRIVVVFHIFGPDYCRQRVRRHETPPAIKHHRDIPVCSEPKACPLPDQGPSSKCRGLPSQTVSLSMFPYTNTLF